MAAATPDPNTEDQWEVINDDGFVYKRKRRRLDPTRLPPPSFPDPGLEQKFKTRRKLNALLSIKTKYQNEIQLWEDLAGKLKHLEQNVRLNSGIDGGLVEGEGGDSGKNPGLGSGSRLENGRRIGAFGVDDIIFQVEAQLAVIHKLSNLCDVAEALCDAHEEKTNESFFDLPIWGSPRELMSSLCQD